MRGGLRIGQPFSLIVNPVSWSGKGVSIRHYVNADRPSNNRAKLALAEAAHSARGHAFELVNGIPYVANQVAITVPKGPGVHGGMTRDQKRAAAEAHYAVSLNRLQQKASASRQPVPAY